MIGLSEDFDRGAIAILQEIGDNNEGQKFTHTEVRAYARCFLSFFRQERADPRLLTLLNLLAARDIPHYDRAFLAREIVRILKERQETIDRLDRQPLIVVDLL